MGAIIEIKYFNSFILKKLSKSTTTNAPVYNGSFGIPAGLGGYPAFSDDSADYNSSVWAIEEARIRGGFNNTNVDYGVRSYLVKDEPTSSNLFNTLLYSGIFNSRTAFTDTNVFS